MNSCPIAVDMDGTLIHTDMLYESMLELARRHPLVLPKLPFWLFQGKAMFKQQLAAVVDFDPGILPYNSELLDWLKTQKASGRKLVLCTASDISVATAIADHLDIFDEVYASDGKRNLSGSNKAALLVEQFGNAGFDYVGNSEADHHVWKMAREAIVVNSSKKLLGTAREKYKISKIFLQPKKNLKDYVKTWRVHQWAKNLLLFVPLFASHQVTELHLWVQLIIAFFAFSFCASAVYIINDLLDLNNDRRHPRKRRRPFASGKMSLLTGVILAPIMLAVGLALAYLVNPAFLMLIVFYFLLTNAYSLWLKRLVLLDCLVLAMLYTLRIISGTVAVDLAVSFWLLAFSVFLFLSLAYVKRYAELHEQGLSSDKRLYGRGYCPEDANLVQVLGIVSGYLSVLVLSLYINSDVVTRLYKVPEVVWGAVPIMLFWVSWVWLKAHRGQMHDDPLVFALKDRASLFSGFLFASVTVVGTVGWSW